MIKTPPMQLLRRGVRIITGQSHVAPLSSRRQLVVAAVLVSVVAPTALAVAQRRTVPVVRASRFLWATVNVCDTERSPNTIGIRGSMPGGRDERETLWMRFQVQYLSDVDDRWHYVTDGGDSGFVAVGSGRQKARESGRSFRIDPNTGRSVLRGRVSFQWRLRGEVVRRATKRTRKGHESSAGADPPNYTASTCTVTR
jgi:hypothetical protein